MKHLLLSCLVAIGLWVSAPVAKAETIKFDACGQDFLATKTCLTPGGYLLQWGQTLLNSQTDASCQVGAETVPSLCYRWAQVGYDGIYVVITRPDMRKFHVMSAWVGSEEPNGAYWQITNMHDGNIMTCTSPWGFVTTTGELVKNTPECSTPESDHVVFGVGNNVPSLAKLDSLTILTTDELPAPIKRRRR